MASISDQNWVVWNQGKNPLVNFNFMLRVEMLFDLPCKSVRAFSRELEYEYIQEIELEEEDFNPDDIFKVNPNGTESIS